jgi:hypothetical protein
MRCSRSFSAGDVGGRRPAVAVEQRPHPQAEHLVDVAVGQRGDPHADVAEQLDQRAAQPGGITIGPNDGSWVTPTTISMPSPTISWTR